MKRQIFNQKRCAKSEQFWKWMHREGEVDSAFQKFLMHTASLQENIWLQTKFTSPRVYFDFHEATAAISARNVHVLAVLCTRQLMSSDHRPDPRQEIISYANVLAVVIWLAYK
jgi:hypothetical protein